MSVKHIELIRREAERARRVLERHHMEISPNELGRFPKGGCGASSDFLSNWLHDMGIEGIEYVTGSRLKLDAKAPSDAQSHAWLEYEGYIIDITADQFPDCKDPVLITKESEIHGTFKDQSRSKPEFTMSLGEEKFIAFMNEQSAPRE